MTMPDITLKQAKQTVGVRTHRASDFLTEDEKLEVKKSNAKGNTGKIKFDAIDAFVGEILGRFGYDTYTAWKAGDIENEQMMRYIAAERAREVAESLSLKSIVVAAVAGANQPTKGGHTPKSLKTAIDILKKEQQKAKGGR